MEERSEDWSPGAPTWSQEEEEKPDAADGSGKMRTGQCLLNLVTCKSLLALKRVGLVTWRLWKLDWFKKKWEEIVFLQMEAKKGGRS